MGKKFYQIGIYFVAITMVTGLLGLMPSKSVASEQPERKIVVFKSDIIDKNLKDSVIEKAGGTKIKDLRIINGVAVQLTGNAKKLLELNENVLRIDDDAVFSINKRPVRVTPSPTATPTSTPSPSSTPVVSPTPAPSSTPVVSPTPTPVPTATPFQPIQWGVLKVDGGTVDTFNTVQSVALAQVKVAVIDTGISLGHPDLAANIKGGYNAINPLLTADDDNGHGSHVAGIIAAVNNGIGVVGVSTHVDLYAVKVLNRQGSGYISDIIEGIQWSVTNGINVINMSLGASVDIQSFHDAIIAAHNAGVIIVAAAGNNYLGSVDYPGKYEEVIAVSATDSSNAIAYFSSIGPEVDICAPGQSIYSTYKTSAYATLSGTSMASPHVAGAAALVFAKFNNLDPDEIKGLLQSSATDLGTAGPDNIYGDGLVNVYKALGY